MSRGELLPLDLMGESTTPGRYHRDRPGVCWDGERATHVSGRPGSRRWWCASCAQERIDAGQECWPLP